MRLLILDVKGGNNALRATGFDVSLRQSRRRPDDDIGS
jgi:hypothetical protein